MIPSIMAMLDGSRPSHIAAFPFQSVTDNRWKRWPSVLVCLCVRASVTDVTSLPQRLQGLLLVVHVSGGEPEREPLPA